MLKEWNTAIRKFEFATDLCLVTVCYFLIYLVRSSSIIGLPPLPPISTYLLPLYFSVPLWTNFLYTCDVYTSRRIGSLFRAVSPVLRAWLFVGITLPALLFMLRLHHYSAGFVFAYLALSGTVLTAKRIVGYGVLRRIRSKGLNTRNMIIVGTGQRAQAFADALNNHPEWGIRISGFVDEDPEMVGAKLKNGDVIGSLDQLPHLITSMQVDEVVFVVPRKWIDKLTDAVLVCEKVGINARLAADFFSHEIAQTAIEEIDGLPLLTFNPTPHPAGARLMKQAFDLAVAPVMLVLSAPLFVLAAIGIKLTSPGPIFFKQERCGLNGRKFKMLKFRTMVHNAEALKHKIGHMNEMSGPVFKARNDPRVTRFGAFLRKFSLDELPQLINVLQGDMSIVGPRPPVPEEVAKYDLAERRRLSMKPGLTCLWQVKGRNNTDFHDWMKLDLQYIDNWSLLLDLKILLLTFPAVITGTGM